MKIDSTNDGGWCRVMTRRDLKNWTWIFECQNDDGTKTLSFPLNGYQDISKKDKSIYNIHLYCSPYVIKCLEFFSLLYITILHPHLMNWHFLMYVLFLQTMYFCFVPILISYFQNYFLETFHLLILLNRISGSRMQNCFTQRWVWMVLQTFISWLQGGLSKSWPQIHYTPEWIKILT